MFCIGEVSPEKKRLVQVTRECVKKGLEQVKPWGFLGDMGQAVHDMQRQTATRWFVKLAVTVSDLSSMRSHGLVIILNEAKRCC